MIRLYTERFVTLTHYMLVLQVSTAPYAPGTVQAVGLLKNPEIAAACAHLKEVFIDLDMPMCKKHLQTLVDGFERGEKWTPDHVKGVVSILYASLMGELEGRLFLGIGLTGAEAWKSEANFFGPTVRDKFQQSLTYDIEECARCFALERSTAAAFHALRCLEAGIRALSRSLRIPDPTKASERSWAKCLKSVKDATDAKWPTNSDRMAGDGQFFDDAYAALAAMQNPWRNATMHLDQKYTQEEARHIIEIVRGFMTRVANRMDENGSPLA